MQHQTGTKRYKNTNEWEGKVDPLGTVQATKL